MTKQEVIASIETAIKDQTTVLVRIFAGTLVNALKLLKDQPDIVRCKDCKNKEKDGISEGFHYCNINGLQVTDDWFCADGKRRDDDSNDDG